LNAIGPCEIPRSSLIRNVAVSIDTDCSSVSNGSALPTSVNRHLRFCAPSDALVDSAEPVAADAGVADSTRIAHRIVSSANGDMFRRKPI
jgi:hypothetical protein